MLDSGDLDVYSHMVDDHIVSLSSIYSEIPNPRLQKIGPKDSRTCELPECCEKLHTIECVIRTPGPPKPQHFGQSNGFKMVRGWNFTVSYSVAQEGHDA